MLFSIQITPRLSQPHDSIPWLKSKEYRLKRRSLNPYDSTPWLKRRSRNISVTIGPSESYDPNEQPCLPMFDLVLQEGLYEYRCTGELHQGKYVKITRGLDGSGGLINICEVKIFTVGGNHTLCCSIIGGIIQSYYLWQSHQVYKYSSFENGCPLKLTFSESLIIRSFYSNCH